MTPPLDSGLQLERTELAWRRTGLALATASLVGARLLPVALGHPAWCLVGVGGVLTSAILWVVGRRRQRAAAAGFGAGDSGRPSPDGRVLIGLTAAMTMIGAGGVAAVVVTAVP